MTNERQREYLRQYYRTHRVERLKEQKEKYANDPEYRERRKHEAREYAIRNKERLTVYRKAYYRANRKRAAESHARKQANPEWRARRAAYDRAYKDANRDKINAYQHARARSYKRGHTVAEWEAKKAEYEFACAYCGRTDKPLERDHIVPVGIGDPQTVDRIENIVPACRSCNARKSGPKRLMAMPNMRPWSGVLPDLICPQCDKGFRPNSRNRPQRCCSNACRFAYLRAHPETHWRNRSQAEHGGAA